MPELPEVETLLRTLLPFLPSQPIISTEVLHEKIIRPLTSAEFDQALLNKRIVEAERRGKYLLLNLEPEGKLLIHLRMTGQLFYKKANGQALEVPHTHIKLGFANGDSLEYADVRRFGLVTYYHDKIEDKGYLNLGPEPLSDDFTAEYLWTQAKRRKTCPIKSFLLDQKVIAGLGNIYADEVLFRSKINPKMAASKLTKNQAETLVAAIKKVLAEAIVLRGSSMSDYLDANRQRGSYQDKWRIYQRDGDMCLRCGNEILKTKIGGRSSHYCPFCQPMRKRPGNKLIIGLTGGIATGKSTVVEMLREIGAEIVDADEISRNLTNKEEAVQEHIITMFGEEYRGLAGGLDRRKLGDLIFQNKAAREKLNNFLHPQIVMRMQDRIREYMENKTDHPLILDIPLLFEAELEAMADLIWLVYADEDIQISRLLSRDNLSLKQAEMRLNAQIPIEDKKELSDFIIDNTGTLEETEEQVWELYQRHGYKIMI
ncbi:MAG: DNA-formamidopyrimidine glycosylase [Firmicutes bacterium]|jgi:DNA-formamidopyrimidine glycosylase/dephospho-CoA kinase|nr:DNA-formamidopyrimidine glycosylase [Bacillota bacterium]